MNQSDNLPDERVLSGMRPTGRLHLGNYHGALKNWVALQEAYDCYFFVADWHALTTHYDSPTTMRENVWELVIDWLAAGLDPEKSAMFIQSHVIEHAELHLLLSMVTPLSWLERVPSFKDQQDRLRDKDLSTYGFLGYPLLQSADILIYRAACVPVGEDQVPHVELTREIARRFNHFFGKDSEYEENAVLVVAKMGKKAARKIKGLRQSFIEQGEREALAEAQALIKDQQNLSAEDKQILLGYLEGRGRSILPEPNALLTSASKMPGLDGQKMSKSYNNTIAMRDDPGQVSQTIRTMPTDPARVRRYDPGDPQKCPVWQFHQVYTAHEVHEWVNDGCKNAGIGCLECKQPLIDAMLVEQEEIRERAAPYESNPQRVREVIEHGDEQARRVAAETMNMVRDAVGTLYDKSS